MTEALLPQLALIGMCDTGVDAARHRSDKLPTRHSGVDHVLCAEKVYSFAAGQAV